MFPWIPLISQKKTKDSSVTRNFRQGHQSTGAGRGGLDAADLGQRVVGFHQDVTVRGEFRKIRSDYLGGGRTCYRAGVDGARGDVGRTPEEDNEQRDSAESADVGHFARFSRLIASTLRPTQDSIPRSIDETHRSFEKLSRRSPSERNRTKARRSGASSS